MRNFEEDKVCNNNKCENNNNNNNNSKKRWFAGDSGVNNITKQVSFSLDEEYFG